MELQNRYYTYPLLGVRRKHERLSETTSELYKRRITELIDKAGLRGSETCPFCSLPIMEYYIQYFFEITGKPTWYVAPEIMDFLSNVNVDIRDCELTIPKEVLRICMPCGYTHKNIPLRSILLVVARSSFFNDAISSIVSGVSDQSCNNVFTQYFHVAVDCGWDGKDGYSWDSPRTRVMLAATHKSKIGDLFGSNPNNRDNSLNEMQTMIQAHAVKIAFATIMYAQARPDAIKRERTSKKGKRIKMHGHNRFIAPIKHLPKTPVEYDGEPEKTDRKSRPHLRGWVLRHLKDERFRRNEDGSIRTVLVAPCLINAESIDEINSLPDKSIVK